MNHKYFIMIERNKIDFSLRKYSVNEISKIIGVYFSIIYYKIKRCHFVQIFY